MKSPNGVTGPVWSRKASTDFLVIGGGVIGLNLALEARRRYPGASITLIEKEPRCGRHASGRNSGVLHAGFYYTADSLKARFTRDGNRELTEYCESRGIPVRRCGKLVVARDESDLPGLDELLRRARLNGVELEPVTGAEARQIEPRARTHERALFSPTTSSVEPGRVVQALVEDARRAGITILTGTRYLRREGALVRTSAGRICPGYVINAAGLYADRIARDYGFSDSHRILPFKGLYLRNRRSDLALRTHVYPVPDAHYPFLGVHFTVGADGDVKIGPSATPAFWREHYNGFGGFRPGEALEILRLGAGLLLRDDFGFRRLAARELRNHSRRRLLEAASGLLQYRLGRRGWEWSAAGVRAQLLDLRTRELVMDFHFEGDARSFHVLNAVSPAFTCAMPFSRYLFDEIERLGRSPAADRPIEPASRLPQGSVV